MGNTMAFSECDYLSNAYLFVFIGMICGALLTILCTAVIQRYDLTERITQAQMAEHRHTIMTAMEHNS
jgi:hypothetical protein